MSKNEAPGQAVDFATWLARLDEQLSIAGTGYLRRSSDDQDAETIIEAWPPVRSNRTSFAMLALGVVNNALAELPGMRDHVGLVPLHDLTAALIDLGQGGKPPLLRPVEGIGKGSELTVDRWVRAHALLFVAMLEAAGLKAARACGIIADLMAASGHVGRKRDASTGLAAPLSKKTVEHWRNVARQPGLRKRDPKMVAFIARNLERFKGRSDWPMSETTLIQIITSMIQSDLMRSKI